jgi:hypothetical protein
MPRAATGDIHLREQKVLVHLEDAEEERKAESWVLDTGATNHMSGSRSAFVELDKAVCGTVRFRFVKWRGLQGVVRLSSGARMVSRVHSLASTTFPNSRPTS